MKRILLSLLLLCPLFLLQAADTKRDLQRETAIEEQLAQVNPALVGPFRQARLAMDAGNYVETERLLTEVVRQAPDFDPALRRLGSALVNNGKAAEGRKLLERAVTQSRSMENLFTMAYSLAYPGKGTASEQDRLEALGLLLACRGLPRGDELDVLAVTAQLAYQLDNRAEAAAAVALLEQKHPGQMLTHYFSAFAAAEKEDWIRAEDEMKRAGELGLPADTVRQFLDGGVHSRALFWRWVRGTCWLVGGWIAGLGLLCAGGFALSVLTLRQIERADPRVPITPGEQNLRKVYRTVLNFAGIYYYISLPVVVALVVLASGALLYGFLVAGWLPIKLSVLIVIGLFATIWSMGKSLFLRVKAEDPGRPLERAEAEGLWQLSEQVAQDLETRPIDEIRITPGTDLCVYERGTWREKLDNRAKRVLVVGAAVLNGFKIADFRSVLAHEYGHFSHRDTAGGDIALRVRNDMIKFYIAMLEAGQNSWLNIAFHFLRFYNFIFVRISHGATRLQEVLADRVAALHYGPAAFEAGLRHVIRRSVDFDFLADREIKKALKGRQPIANLYTAPDPQQDMVRDAFTEAMERPTTPDDTHPGPKDRFRLIASLPEPPRRAMDGHVWDLFRDRDIITKEMMELVERNVAPHRPLAE